MPAPSLFRLLSAAAVLAAASAATPALAQQLPAAHEAGNLRYQCGGIGVDESSAMRAAMKDHPLSLLFARADGAYEANIDVRITPQGGSGQAMGFVANGPVCLLQLPAGSYKVDVQGAGQSHSRTVKVGGAPQSLDFRF
ncbi:hypothetical protein [Pulveribacter suum]|uniref:Carboxypeptidase regulatory-like domain-containing protein n=1 Tax=Pulveribacter suum TaxID=2116657 RepID=A0A2P1NGQ8_9BURK|nr:hypothetical protein [Pulveribacter suum]AVP56267.1 hypothetical protein C7H73_00365 [Pulveribacter suum]